MKRISILLLTVFVLLQCKEEKKTYVDFVTNYGKIRVLLFDDTPLHKANFIKLCSNGQYDNVLFHRVIKDFVMQGGDLTSKAHEPGVVYGEASGGYTIDAEINPKHICKRGALIDAQESIDVNPFNKSAGTQFCFIQGKKFSDEALDKVEVRMNSWHKERLFYQSLFYLKQNGFKGDSSLMAEKAKYMADSIFQKQGPVIISKENREIYKTIGGCPHLDNIFTVFGEVVEGLDIVEKVTCVPTDTNDRPLKDVIILSTIVDTK